MDRAELPGVIIPEVCAILTDVLLAAAPTLLTADLDGVERCLQAVSRQVMGPVVERVLAARVAAADPRPPRCGACGARMRCAGRARPRRLQGLVGDYTLRRPYSLCATCRTGVAPLDAQWGLDGSAISPGLGRVLARAGLDGPFAAAADQVAETLGVVVPAEAVRRLTEGVGAVAEAEQQAFLARARRGEPIAPLLVAGDAAPPTMLVVEVDGVQAPLLAGWQEVKVSRVAPLGPGLRTDPETGRTHLALGRSRSGAGLEGAEACWWRTYASACQLGLGASVALVVLLGDGAEWIWAHGRRFPALAEVELVEIVDISHAYEHRWAVGAAVFGVGTAAATAWVEPLKDRLYREGASAVLAALAALITPVDEAPAPPVEEPVAATAPTEAEAAAPTGPALPPAAAEAVRLATGYFTTHAARMDYPSFVARQFPIGSGAAESACKALIGQRAKQAGMRWCPAGLQAVVSRRARHHSGDWASCWQTHPQRRRPPVVAPRPVADPTAVPAATAPAGPTPLPASATADPRPALVPTGRHDDQFRAPMPLPLAIPPTPLLTASRARPAADHPWRRPLRPRARSA